MYISVILSASRLYAYTLLIFSIISICHKLSILHFISCSVSFPLLSPAICAVDRLHVHTHFLSLTDFRLSLFKMKCWCGAAIVLCLLNTVFLISFITIYNFHFSSNLCPLTSPLFLFRSSHLLRSFRRLKLSEQMSDIPPLGLLIGYIWTSKAPNSCSIIIHASGGTQSILLLLVSSCRAAGWLTRLPFYQKVMGLIPATAKVPSTTVCSVGVSFTVTLLTCLPTTF